MLTISGEPESKFRFTVPCAITFVACFVTMTLPPFVIPKSNPPPTGVYVMVNCLVWPGRRRRDDPVPSLLLMFMVYPGIAPADIWKISPPVCG
jgi:hypothetical protein